MKNFMKIKTSTCDFHKTDSEKNSRFFRKARQILKPPANNRSRKRKFSVLIDEKYSMQTEMRLDFPGIRCYVDCQTAMKGKKQTTEIQMK